jgi:hypothetical protein
MQLGTVRASARKFSTKHADAVQCQQSVNEAEMVGEVTDVRVVEVYVASPISESKKDLASREQKLPRSQRRSSSGGNAESSLNQFQAVAPKEDQRRNREQKNQGGPKSALSQEKLMGLEGVTRADLHDARLTLDLSEVGPV